MTRSLLPLLTLALCLQAQTDHQAYEALVRESHGKHDAPSLAVAVVHGDRTVFSYAIGHADVAAERLATTRTRYRIGSLTKVFTTTLLVQLRDAGILRLDDPVVRYLPEGVRLPRDPRGAPHVTLRHLAQHASGLPERPVDVPPGEVYYWGDYTAERLYRGLARTELVFPAGTDVLYSNLGLGLLGHTLSRAAKKPFDDLLHERLLDPLGMKATSMRTAAQLDASCATGYLPGGEARPARPWDLGCLDACGALVSDVHDMARFLSFQLRGGEAGLEPVAGGSLLELHRPLRILDDWRRAIALGWMVDHSDDLGPIVRHNGGMAGFTSHMSFSPLRGVGVIVLTNVGVGGKSPARSLGSTLLREAARRHAPVNRAVAAIVDDLPRHFRDPVGDDVLSLFTPAFLERIPPGAIRGAFAEMFRKHGACRGVASVEVGRTPWHATAVLEFTDGHRTTCTLQVAASRPRRLVYLALD